MTERTRRKTAAKRSLGLNAGPGFLRTGLYFLLLLQLTACGNEPAGDNERKVRENRLQNGKPAARSACPDCHDYHLDLPHSRLECTFCHQGESPAVSSESAHNSLVSQPAHPDNMTANCGRCHPDQVRRARTSSHFTLAGEVNTVRRAFGANASLASLTGIPVADSPASPLELADDMLRRRCLRCHVYWPGAFYPETVHGTGCAACHLGYEDGELQSHTFLALPPDRQCLHCHHGNYAGGDYYGLYEHDFHWAYRTPYSQEGLTPDRPYGVETHRLSPDLHQKAGLACIDCHNGRELMTDETSAKIRCLTCHQGKLEEVSDRGNLHFEGDRLLLTAMISGRVLEVPQLQHPAHDRYSDTVSCQVCHSKWSYSDIGTHLIRLDIQDYEPWGNLDVQGSFEAEAEIADTLYGAGQYPYPFMQDKITGLSSRGLWLKGFELRRWETPLFCRDRQGVLQVCRPVLDLHLSWVDENGDVVFDAVTPDRSPAGGLLPYAPHTIGRAGPFFRERLKENIDLLQKPYFLNRQTKDNNPTGGKNHQ